MLSIIIPVYNGEKYIERCIQALINQKEEIEIIIINDGSKDNTKQKLEKYKEEKRIKIVNQENKGVSSARNTGLKLATGEYVMFCDIDDCYDNNVLNKVSAVLSDKSFDLLIFGRKDIEDDKVLCIYPIEKINQDNITGQEYLEKYFSCGKHTYSVVNKVYKKEIIIKNKIKFEQKLRYSEDTLFNLEYISKCNKIEVVDDCYYLRFCNQGSAVYRKCNGFFFDNIKIIDLYIDKVKDSKKNKKAIDELYQHYAIVSIFRICDGIDANGKKEDIVEIRNILNYIKSKKVVINTNNQSKRNKFMLFLMKHKQSVAIYFIFAYIRRKVQRYKEEREKR